MACQIRWHGCLSNGSPQSRDHHRGHSKKMLTLSARREMATKVVLLFAISIQLACNIFKVSKGGYRYQPMLADQHQLITDWLLRITNIQRNWGFGLCFIYQRNINRFVLNYKWAYWTYRELELNLRIKPKKRLVSQKPRSGRACLAQPLLADRFYAG